MTRLNSTRLALSVLLAGSALVAVLPAHAQPMMGNTGMHHDSDRMHDRMAKQIEKRQAELKAKLHLAPAQEPAWGTAPAGEVTQGWGGKAAPPPTTVWPER